MRPIYLDNNATTPTDPRVVEEMAPLWHERFGNPSSSSHYFGWEAQSLVEKARRRLATLIGAEKSGIFFTSGATESNNTVLCALTRHRDLKGRHIITSRIEHKCVLETCRMLESSGFKITYLDVDAEGLIAPAAVAAAITSDTCLISIMAANNEIATLQPIADIGRIAKSSGILFHTDAAQLVGKLPIDVDAHNIDFLSLSSHKLYGPMGVGALYARYPSLLSAQPLMRGGGQESGVRPGTLNVPGIVGLGKAAELAGEMMAAESLRLARLKDRFVDQFLLAVAGVHVNGHRTQCLPGTVNLRVTGIDAFELMSRLKAELAFSSGSACASHDQEPSHVLSALGLTREQASSSFRIGIGRFNGESDLDIALTKFVAAIAQMPRKAVGEAA